MFYLFLGDDHTSKNSRINTIKLKYLTAPDSVNFDLESLDAKGLDPADLKKAFVTLPVVSSKRVIVIRNIEKAKGHLQEVVLEFLEKKEDHHVIICDSEEEGIDNAFGKKLESLCTTSRFVLQKNQGNVFDVTKAIESRNCVRALELLHGLYERGDHPLQLMSGVIWFWGKSKNRLSAENFNEGLRVLQEADVNIKRSRLNAEDALEFAVVKLTELMKARN